MSIEIPKILEKEIKDFAKLNDIEDIDDFIISCIRGGFNIAKYGYSPKDNFNKENKPFKEEDYDTEKENYSSRVEGEGDSKKKGRPKKEKTVEERFIEPIKKAEEAVKPKKKILIINN